MLLLLLKKADSLQLNLLQQQVMMIIDKNHRKNNNNNQGIHTYVRMVELPTDPRFSLQFLEVSLRQFPGVDDLGCELETCTLLNTSPDDRKGSLPKFFLKFIIIRETSSNDRCSHFRSAGRMLLLEPLSLVPQTVPLNEK